MLKEATEGAFFSHTQIPLVIMAVDLTARAPVAQRRGPLWEALLAALSVAGVFPTQERNGHRLIDAIALVPVPTAAVLEDGADIVVSVNLLGTETLERWPGVPDEPEGEPAKPRRHGPLDTILEAMDLSQLDTSARHAALADVVITPRSARPSGATFTSPTCSWRPAGSPRASRCRRCARSRRPVDVDAAASRGEHRLIASRPIAVTRASRSPP